MATKKSVKKEAEKTNDAVEEVVIIEGEENKACNAPYNGWLLSDNIIKRSFAVMGHNLLATLIIYAGLFAFLIILMIIFASFGAAFSLFS